MVALLAARKIASDLRELRDIFRESLETIFLVLRPLDEQKETWRPNQDLVFGPIKNETEQILQKKYAQLTRCNFLCPHRSCRSEAKRRNREITGFDHRSLSIDRKNFPETSDSIGPVYFFSASSIASTT